MPQGKPQTAGRLPRTLSAFRRLFSPDTTHTRAVRPHPRPVRPLRPRAPQSVESQAAALDTLINAEKPRAGPPPGLRKALSELVGFSRVFSSRRLSRTARDPADWSRPRHPPPHYDRIERRRTRRTRAVRNFDADVGTGWVRSVEETVTTTTTPVEATTTTPDEPTTTPNEAPTTPDEATTTPDEIPTTTPTPTPTPTTPSEIPTPSSSTTLNIIHARYNHFLSHADVQTVVDIGAGTGSWSLYVVYKLRLNAPIPIPSASRLRIIAVDRAPLVQMRGVERIQGDICDADTQQLVDGALEAARVDVVLCDVTLETAGSQMMDAAQSLNVCRRVWEFARWRLRTEAEVGREGGGVLL